MIHLKILTRWSTMESIDLSVLLALPPIKCGSLGKPVHVIDLVSSSIKKDGIN